MIAIASVGTRTLIMRFISKWTGMRWPIEQGPIATSNGSASLVDGGNKWCVRRHWTHAMFNSGSDSAFKSGALQQLQRDVAPAITTGAMFSFLSLCYEDHSLLFFSFFCVCVFCFSFLFLLVWLFGLVQFGGTGWFFFILWLVAPVVMVMPLSKEDQSSSQSRNKMAPCNQPALPNVPWHAEWIRSPEVL